MASTYNGNGQSAQNGEHANAAKKPAPQTQASSSSSQPKRSDASFFDTLKKLRKASARPLPTEMGDGTYRAVSKRPGLSADLRSLSMKDLKTLLEVVSAKLKGETQQDDKTMIMERTIQVVAGLPNHSKTQEILTNDLVDQLWNSLDHPPLLYMGDKFKWRQPDGSFNNPLMPKLGATNQPYSRTVKPKVTSLGAQPDPESVYEAIMARDGFKKNPNNVSSILWYWATIVIHDLFWTNMQDGNINESSSYLDLAPLYGHNQEMLDSIRTFKDGMIKADTFADKRLLGNPPGVVILLIMFNRFHNNVAKQLAIINEDNRFPKPTPNLSEEAAAAAWKKRDEELFQTARLVTSGLYINIMLIDYVRNIVNLNRVNTTWTLDPRQEMGVSVGTKEGAASGVGNVVSAEFNLCYRWHSCISEMDEKWIEDFYTQLLGEDYGTLNLQTLIKAVKKFEMGIADDPAERTFSGLKRGPDGKFDDDELVDLLATAIEQPGGAFGARNVPRIMKPVEILGIIRGRRWNLAGLNEFRKHFGLKAYETFEDINSDKEVAEQLRNLYQHPDYVELYPGIVAEEAKSPMVPGVGITPTYTISRVVLSDAVSLVRGDRYYTTDYHPGNLTNWGFKEVEYDLSVNNGCSFYKLFLRAFPNHFKKNSIYAHFPMVIPSENVKIMKNLGWEGRYDFSRPGRQASRTTVSSYGGAQYVLANQDKFRGAWKEDLEYLVGRAARDFTLPSDVQLSAGQGKSMHELLYKTGWKTAVKAFYSMVTERLLVEKAYNIAGKKQVDVVRDVGNLAHTHFVARLFNLPLKDKHNPKGIFSEQELYKTLSLIFVSVFCDIDPARAYDLRLTARDSVNKLGNVVETNVKLAKTFGRRGLYTVKAKDDPLSAYGVNLVKELAKSGESAPDVTWGRIIPTAGALVPPQGQVFAEAVDWYLSPAGDGHREEIARVAAQHSSDESDALLLGYAMEGIRMAGTFGHFRDVTTADTISEDDGRTLAVQPGDRLSVSLVSAARDPTHFPEPDTVNPRRPLESYSHCSAGPYAYVGQEMSQVALVEMFRAVFRKKGLRRAGGAAGELKKVPREDGHVAYMSEDWGRLWPLPTTMKVTWDGE